jgi:pimeloyl-ACP methyl ester carboxylesterase
MPVSAQRHATNRQVINDADTQVSTLAIWGKGDPFFIPPGAEAYKRDNPNAVVELLDNGHFAL